MSVAGVRYRARKLSATLHPTVPVHAPLVFDLIDRWMNRSIGQCTYHVAPPDGREYAARPADAAEAEKRRLERFQVRLSALTANVARRRKPNPIFPGTLDLRMLPTAQQGRRHSGERSS